MTPEDSSDFKGNTIVYKVTGKKMHEKEHRVSTTKRVRTQETVHAAVIDHKQSTNVTEPAIEPDNSNNPKRSNLLERLSSPIASAVSNNKTSSELIDTSTTIDTYNNQNTSPYSERNKEPCAHRTVQHHLELQ
ncbi:hypothetical protein PGT21_025545 [Puccinia graminis f. sp. tritici]|uniref:Uncharacterized protein n=1 Tax=Puccinia graminis f. sp. tritici TaxID=56615 RepID=A0A5B0MDJ1_PUCGR|nr:hypothetical protein PGT21_025545 [Puccinia graminis f. sp. tritici]